MTNNKIAVIGLGYVGLPLAMAFAEKHIVKAFDIDTGRIDALKTGNDHTLEAEEPEIRRLQQQYPGNKTGIVFTSNAADLGDCNVYIVTVPTPVDIANKPNLTLLEEASRTVGAVLKPGDIVIYESTVYPGCTEEIAVPILEEISGLQFNRDFYCGYSPERINPGDKQKKISQIRKITSGSNEATAKKVDELYQTIIDAGTYPAPSIKVAEAAKAIENAQRDINIAFVNEMAKICNQLGIDTHEVLKAAATKWNFLRFEPGLVGGHCIGVDPYYLVYRSIAAGYQPEIMLAARKINDSMGEYVAGRLIALMAKKQIPLAGAEVLVMGISFKENFPDIRNSRVIDIMRVLDTWGMKITLFDPVATPETVQKEYGRSSLSELPTGKKFNAVLVAVNHTAFHEINYSALLHSPGVLYDVKGHLQHPLVDGRL